MTLRVSGKSLDIGEALRQHGLEKVEKTAVRFREGSVHGPAAMARVGSHTYGFDHHNNAGSDRVSVAHPGGDEAIGWLDAQASRDPGAA